MRNIISIIAVVLFAALGAGVLMTSPEQHESPSVNPETIRVSCVDNTGNLDSFFMVKPLFEGFTTEEESGLMEDYIAGYCKSVM